VDAAALGDVVGLHPDVAGVVTEVQRERDLAGVAGLDVGELHQRLHFLARHGVGPEVRFFEGRDVRTVQHRKVRAVAVFVLFVREIAVAELAGVVVGGDRLFAVAVVVGVGADEGSGWALMKVCPSPKS
jgi:hypothetical protein